VKPRIVVISGPVGAGKSTLARGLAERFDAAHLRTRDFMAARAQRASEVLPRDRAGLQAFGERLDNETGGAWVAQDLAEVVGEVARGRLIVVDGVRIAGQVDAMRAAFGRDVVHLHLHAPYEELAARYQRRRQSGSEIEELSSYDDVARNPTEAQVPELAADADVAIDSKRCTPEDVEVRAAAELGLLARGSHQLVDIIVGGEYGSEGKGNIAFYLAREYDILVRVGGPNAGHKVPMPTVFTHRSLPSGTMANEAAKLVVGAGAVLNLTVLQQEIADCGVEVDRLSIDPQAMVIEAADISAELAHVADIGSTGSGVGAATARRIMGRTNAGVDVPVRLARDVHDLTPYIRPAFDVLSEAFAARRSILLEGTQGTALSLYHGSYPYVTSRDTTAAGCLAEAGIAPSRVRRVILVCRTYPIRVADGSGGTSGPMEQQISWEDLAGRSGISLEELLEVEKGSVSGKQRRVSEFDWALLRRAVELNGATDIALTFADYLDVANRDARRFDQLTAETIRFIEEVERVAGVPVSLIGTRFAVRSVIDRRQW
jgi:adenylosuccinate synthase